MKQIEDLDGIMLHSTGVYFLTIRDWIPMNIIKFLFQQSWKLLLISAITGVIGGLLRGSLVKVVADGVNEQGSRITLMWIFLGLCIGSVIFKLVSSISLLHLSQNATYHMRIDLSRKFLATSHMKIRAIGKAECLGIFTNDIMTFAQAFQLIPDAFSNSILIFTCMVYMAWLSWQLFLFFSIILIVGVLSYQYAERIPLRKMGQLRDQMDALLKNFHNLIEGSKELQLNKQKATYFIDAVIEPDANIYKKMYISTMTGWAGISYIGEILFFLSIGLILFVVPMWLSVPAETITRFTLILLFLIGPISTLIMTLPVLGQGGVSLKKIQQMDGQLANIASPQLATAQFTRGAPLHLELKGVCHHYPGKTEERQFMLGPLDFSIRQGELIFIVGGNGSGKTTLAMLLLGFYEPELGTLQLNGKIVDPSNLDEYRQHFSAIFADFHLFEHLFGNNKDQISVRASYFLDKFDMAHKVNVVDGKFNTIDLSMGQRKRLALVSSYLEDRQIYLFDEWAADQDPVFKRIFYTELLPDLKSRGKTVVIITHDDAYFPYADRVVKLVDGQLQEIVSSTDLSHRV